MPSSHHDNSRDVKIRTEVIQSIAAQFSYVARNLPAVQEALDRRLVEIQRLEMIEAAARVVVRKAKAEYDALEPEAEPHECWTEVEQLADALDDNHLAGVRLSDTYKPVADYPAENFRREDA